MTGGSSKISGEEATRDMVETASELEWEAGPENVTYLLQFHDQSWVGEELLLVDEQRKWFPEMESTAGEEAVDTAEMTTKDLGCSVNLGDTAAATLKSMNSSFESNSVDKMLSNSMAC